MYEQIIQSPNHFFFSTCNIIGVNDIITKVVVAFLGIGYVVHIFITFLHQLVVFTFDHHNGVKGKIPRCSMRSNFFGEYIFKQDISGSYASSDMTAENEIFLIFLTPFSCL